MKSLHSCLRTWFTTLMGYTMVNRWLVFVTDIAFSLLAFVLALLVRHLVDPLNGLPNQWAWGLYYITISGVAFKLFNSYRGLIRHTNFQELWRVFAALIVSNAFFLLTLILAEVVLPFRGLFTLNLLAYSLSMLLGMRLLIVYRKHSA